MKINSLQPNIINLTSPGFTTTGAKVPQITVGAQGAFKNILADAFRDANEMDAADKKSALELLSGQTDDLSGLLIDAQKAEISLNLALQLRNKFVDAYNEIMRMQV